jgi:high-affinity nickel-transport protein
MAAGNSRLLFGAHFNSLGFAIIGLFATTWAGSYFIYRWKRFDEIEVVIDGPK